MFDPRMFAALARLLELDHQSTIAMQSGGAININAMLYFQAYGESTCLHIALDAVGEQRNIFAITADSCGDVAAQIYHAGLAQDFVTLTSITGIACGVNARQIAKIVPLQEHGALIVWKDCGALLVRESLKTIEARVIEAQRSHALPVRAGDALGVA